MNERIKELAEQAAHDTRAIHNNAYWRMQEQMAEDITWRERFAELLIRDVTETATKYRQSKTRPVGWNFRHTVLDHYGLKENDSPSK